MTRHFSTEISSRKVTNPKPLDEPVLLAQHLSSTRTAPGCFAGADSSCLATQYVLSSLLQGMEPFT